MNSHSTETLQPCSFRTFIPVYYCSIARSPCYRQHPYSMLSLLASSRTN